jgi:hypothetical protein
MGCVLRTTILPSLPAKDEGKRVVGNAVSHCADLRGLGPSAAHAGGLEWRVCNQGGGREGSANIKRRSLRFARNSHRRQEQ